MSSQTGRTGDADSPTSVASPATQRAEEPPQRPLLGYMRISPAVSGHEVERLRRALATYAHQEGFTLLRVFVDDSPMHTTGFAELIHALQTGEAAHVVVPALHHLAHFPSIQLAMKELLESQTGARVLVMYPTLGELS